MDTEWPFDDPKNVAVFSLRSIFRDGKPILLVTHDEDDGAWQFLDGSDNPSEDDAWIVALERVVKLDPSVRELADLPHGWIAWRRDASAPWQRELKAAGGTAEK